MSRRDRYDETTWEREEEAYYFKENTIWLRKHYQQIHLLKAEIRQLEEEKNKLYEAAYTTTDWGKVKVDGGQISDPTFQVVTRLQKLEERHFWATRTLRVLEWARDQLSPEERRLFDAYIIGAKSLTEIARRTGVSWDTVKRRLVRICGEIINRLSLFLKEGCD